MFAQTKPAFKVCENNVEVPTILVEPFKPGEKFQVWVQWFGKSERSDLRGMQFRFPVPIGVDALHWCGLPDRFKVILFGPIRKFPHPHYANKFAREYFSGDPDGRVLYVINPHKAVDDGNGGKIPVAFMVPMTIELADNEVGIISPIDYYDPKVLQDTIDEFNAK